MLTRRDFLQRSALLSGGLGAMAAIPPSILKALGIEPAEGSTFMDAEHVVILMQENRSFDHAFGTLRGVRGFDDPRAITMPGGNPVWLQTDRQGDTYAPFGLNIHGSSSTWMSCLPHDRASQVAAGNEGKHDRWLQVKQSGLKEYSGMPLAIGYYDRSDIPFYHAFADAFTICDQHFCSVQTSTTPNRLFLWTGTNRDPRDPAAKPLLSNGQIDHDSHADWATFPERLEDHGISWKVYQNEIDFPTGLSDSEIAWLGNFGDNPLEYFSQYHVEFSPRRLAALKARMADLEGQLEAPTEGSAAPEEEVTKQEAIRSAIAAIAEELERCSAENFSKLPEKERRLHEKAFTTNTGDPDFRKLATFAYQEGGTEREVQVPQGDVLHQFRQDVSSGKLPTVSWLVAPENFSDHPTAPWYGAWYLSEVLDILTGNPEVWKKTIFILTYDENDGYYDHVPPFVAPHPDRPGSGAASPGLETEREFDEHGHPIGLGYRVPMVIASPWTRGGNVCSEVFDHTSVLRFLEVFISGKSSTPVREPNIGAWRRAICGDLSSAFQPHDGTQAPALPPLERDVYIEGIHRSRYLDPPANFKSLTAGEVRQIRESPGTSPHLPQQEGGTRPSCALPYELHAEGCLNRETRSFAITFEASDRTFGNKAAGAPFHVYAPGRYFPEDAATYTDAVAPYEEARRWSYAVSAGDKLDYSWPLACFEDGFYQLRTYGPNGFYREYSGDADDPPVEIACTYDGSRLVITLSNHNPTRAANITLTDNSYGNPPVNFDLAPAASATAPFDLTDSSRWYDVGVSIAGSSRFGRRYAGRVENGEPGQSDPLIGRERAATADLPSAGESIKQ